MNNYVDFTECLTEMNYVMRGQNKFGYGMKISTRYKVKINNIWRRVYCSCFSNVACFWVLVNKQRQYIDELKLSNMMNTRLV